MKPRRGEFPTPTDAQLDALAQISESDKVRVKQAAERHGSAKLVAILNAETLPKPAPKQ